MLVRLLVLMIPTPATIFVLVFIVVVLAMKKFV